MARDSDVGGLRESPFIQQALSLRQPPSWARRKVLRPQCMHDAIRAQSATLPRTARVISGAAGVLAPDRGMATRQGPRRCFWMLLAFSPLPFSAGPLAGGRPAEGPRTPGSGRPPSPPAG